MVPERLAERITDWLPGAIKIDIKVKAAGGWRVINTIHLDGNEEPSDAFTMVKACCDHHVGDTGEGGRYRALVWRRVGGVENERRRITFTVRPPFEEEDGAATAEGTEQRDQRSGWQDLVDAQQRFVEFLAKYNEKATDRVLEQSKQDSERLNPLADVIHELVGPYRDGLRMKADAVREVGELRVRQQLAEAQANDAGRFWETFGPAIQVAAAQAGNRLLGGGGGRPKALPAAPRVVPVVQRSEVPTAVVAAPAAPPPPSSPPPAAPPSQPPPGSPPPCTLHELAAALLEGLGTDALVALSRQLDEDQARFLQVIARATDDDTSAEAIVGLMQSLMANPAGIVSMQNALGMEQIAAFRQIAVLATRHLEERALQRGEAAPSDSESTASPGKDDAGA